MKVEIWKIMKKSKLESANEKIILINSFTQLLARLKILVFSNKTHA